MRASVGLLLRAGCVRAWARCTAQRVCLQMLVESSHSVGHTGLGGTGAPVCCQVMVEVMSNVFLKNSKSQSDVEVYLQVRLGRPTAERTVLDGTRVLQRY